MIPKKGDEIVQLGNRTNPSRQNAIILSTVGVDAPSFKQYQNINDYLTEANMLSDYFTVIAPSEIGVRTNSAPSA